MNLPIVDPMTPDFMRAIAAAVKEMGITGVKIRGRRDVVAAEQATIVEIGIFFGSVLSLSNEIEFSKEQLRDYAIQSVRQFRGELLSILGMPKQSAIEALRHNILESIKREEVKSQEQDQANRAVEKQVIEFFDQLLYGNLANELSKVSDSKSDSCNSAQ